MILFRKTIILFLVLILAGGCRTKKKPSLTGNEPVEVSDFLDFYKPLPLPFAYGDTSIARIKKENDSLLISYAVFTQFVPDSIFHRVHNKKYKPKIYAMGKVAIPGAETYLYTKTVAADRKALFLIVLDRKDKYVTAMAALAPALNKGSTQTFIMDRRLTITKLMTRRNSDGTISEGKDVYSYNNAMRSFTLIMTDAMDDKPGELINPIDTLPRKHKWSADYIKGNRNLVSIRDGRRADRISFFIHFEKSKDCSGEMKGEAIMRGANIAEYNKDGDPCKLQFIFNSSSVTLKEMEGCGSYRPLNCSFNASFAKKKIPKKKNNRK